MTTFCYSILHFLVDGICAASMFSLLLNGNGGQWSLLIYNFCAFVLQMPFGVLLDSRNVNSGKIAEASYGCPGTGGGASGRNSAFLFALAGVILTVAGAFTSPILLGIGNALFHVGGGVGTILEDRACGSAGRRLGIFVAPGAMGLYLGRLAAKNSFGPAALDGGMLWVIGSAVPAAILLVLLRRVLTVSKISEEHVSDAQNLSLRPCDILIITGCFLVVVIRSYVGLAVKMPWRTTAAAGLAATAAVVLGKMAGGLTAAELGRTRAVLLSLIAAAVCYAFCDRLIPGISALFLFNMTMPITLQLLADRYRNTPGTMFGLLTVGLFLGYLPVFFSAGTPVSGNHTGAVLSLVSLVVLLAASMSGGDRPAEYEKRERPAI